ncbi:hypothetical protein LCGC14_2104100, partial [marine sediment metagenome]
MEDVFGPVISCYSRAEAIADGVLVDLMQGGTKRWMAALCREHYKHPIACTAAVWALIEEAIENKKHCNDLLGVLHDILWMNRK